MPWISRSFPCDRRRALRRFPAVAVLLFGAFAATFLRFLAVAFCFATFFFAAFLPAFLFATFFLLVFLATCFFFAAFFIALAFLRTGFFLAAVFRRVARFGAGFLFAVLLRPDVAVLLRVLVGFFEAVFLAAMVSALKNLYKTRDYTYATPRVKGF